jgi:hypothetical protein
MTENAELYTALSAAQGEYPEVPKKRVATIRVEKNGKQLSYTYKFADLSDIMSAIRPVLAKHGLSVTQLLATGDDGKIRLRSVLAHKSGEATESVIPLGPFPSEGKAVQTWAGVLTYARRYSLTALVGLAVEDDDDANRAAGHDDYDVADREPAPRQRPAAKPNGNGWEANTGHAAVDKALAAMDAKDPLNIRALPVNERIKTLDWALEDASAKKSAELWLVYSERVKAWDKPKDYARLDAIVTSKALPELAPAPELLGEAADA